jgi:hypothetical protein
MATFPRLRKAWWSIFTDQQASTTFTEGAHRGTTGCRATLRRGGFTSSGGGGFTSAGVGGGTSSGEGHSTSSGSKGRGSGTFSGSAGGAGGTSSLPRFLDGSLDALRLLEEEEALGFTSWLPETVVLGFFWCRG